MPRRRNGQSIRRWYNRICLASTVDSSDSSDSETHSFPRPANIGEDRPFPLPDTPSPATEDATPYVSHSATEVDWQLVPPQPPPPPPFILDQLPQPHMRNRGGVPRSRVNITEISGVGDDHGDVVRNMEITEAITREKTVCPICKEEFKLGGDASKLPCDHFFCFECIHDWLKSDQNNTCPVCRRPLPSRNSRSPGIAVPPPPTLLDSPWEYFFFPPAPHLTESHLVADETQSPSSPSVNNSEASYDTAREEFDGSHAHPQRSIASSIPTTVFP